MKHCIGSVFNNQSSIDLSYDFLIAFTALLVHRYMFRFVELFIKRPKDRSHFISTVRDMLKGYDQQLFVMLWILLPFPHWCYPLQFFLKLCFSIMDAFLLLQIKPLYSTYQKDLSNSLWEPLNTFWAECYESCKFSSQRRAKLQMESRRKFQVSDYALCSDGVQVYICCWWWLIPTKFVTSIYFHASYYSAGENIDPMPNTAVGGTCTNQRAADSAEGKRCTHWP